MLDTGPLSLCFIPLISASQTLLYNIIHNIIYMKTCSRTTREFYITEQLIGRSAIPCSNLLIFKGFSAHVTLILILIYSAALKLFKSVS